MRLSSLLRKITVCSALALLPALTIVPIRPAQAADLTYVEAGSYLTEEDLTASPDTMASPALGTDPADPPGADVPLLTPVDLSLPDEAPDTPDASGVHDLLPDDAGGTEGADASSSQMAAAATSTVIGASGNGIGYTGYEPPDPTIAAGPTRLVLAVNARLASYTKTDPPSKEWSIPFSKWVPSKAWSAGLIYTDPWVVYDTADDRFFFVVLGADSFKDPTKSYLIVGTSPSSSSNGTWCVHHFGFQSGMLPDYPKLGYNADRLYVTANRYQFQNGKRAFLGASLITIPKNPLLSCNNVSAKRFSGLTNLDGSLAFTIQPPTRGGTEPFYMVSAHAELGLYPNGTDFTVWKVEDGGKPSRTTVNVGFYDQPNAAPESDCPTGCLDAADARLLDSVFYAGDIWTTHATAASATVGRSVVRIYGVDAKTGAVTTRTYGATGISCFDPSLSIRPSTGFGALVYTRSSPTQNPVIKVAARINGVWQAAVTAKASSAPYHGNKARHRWGDFAGASPDLGGDRVWTFSEYATGTKTWATWIARVDG